MSSTFQCRACQTGTLVRFLELGDVPPVNAFLELSELGREKCFPLNLGYCPVCSLVQLEEIVPPEKLFSHYLHLSSGSDANLAHLSEVAELVKNRFNITKSHKILEIGSNDGSLLSHLKNLTPFILGVDPAKNLAPLQQARGVPTRASFFNSRTAKEIIKSDGNFDVIIAVNVIPHTPDAVDFLLGVHEVLSTDGTLVMEGVYAIETILKGEFDTIYHEHVYCFSFHSLMHMFKLAHLVVTDVEKIPTQGGSLRVFAKRQETNHSVSKNVQNLLTEEERQGFTNVKIYTGVQKTVDRFRQDLLALVTEHKKRNGNLVALGAPARGVVILNFCGIGPADIKFVVDDTPLKQGLLVPGVHIPVRSWELIDRKFDKSFLLLSWNYKDALFRKLRHFAPGSEVIVPFPKLTVENVG